MLELRTNRHPKNRKNGERHTFLLARRSGPRVFLNENRICSRLTQRAARAHTRNGKIHFPVHIPSIFVFVIFNSPPPPPYEFLTRPRNPDFRIPPTVSPEIADFRAGPKSGDSWPGRLSNTDPRRLAQTANFRTPFSPETRCKTRDGAVRKRAAGTQ